MLQPVAYLADNDADVEAFIAAPAEVRRRQQPRPARLSPAEPREGRHPRLSAPAATTETGRVKASPAARKIAGERGVDLATVAQGSGPGGRILSTDVPAAGVAKPAVAAAVPVRPG